MTFTLQRDEQLARLEAGPETSVLIVGGGINGCAVFRELAHQGVDAVLVDRRDFCSGTSAASSNLIHGGLRYLEYGEFRLVRESIQERNRLLTNAPHYVKPLPVRIPLFSRSSGLLNAPLALLGIPRRPRPRGAWAVRLGLALYDRYSRTVKCDLPDSYMEPRASSLRQFPALNPGICGSAQFHDALLLNAERLALQLLQDGESLSTGSVALNYMRLESLDETGVVVKDLETGRTLPVRPRLIVNAAGPWIDDVNRRLKMSSRQIGGTKGSHLILEHPELYKALRGHMFFFENMDGRIVLICPWHHRVLVGTTDIPVSTAEAEPCTQEEEEYLLAMIPAVFPRIAASARHVLFRYSGVRPLGAAKGPAAAISRDHLLHIAPREGTRPNVYSLVGGKWTTFRAFAEQTADVLLRELGKTRRTPTRDLPIQSPGALEEEQFSLPPDLMEMMRRRYGTPPQALMRELSKEEAQCGITPVAPYLEAELRYLCRCERIVHLDDLLLRRTQLAKLGLLTMAGIEHAARIAGEAKGWGTERRALEIERIAELLLRRHGMQLRRS